MYILYSKLQIYKKINKLKTIEINFDDDFEPPYEVDYALSYEERLSVVKSYYEETYTNAQERFDEFRKDTVAPQYLGELYMPLYDYFLSYSKV